MANLFKKYRSKIRVINWGGGGICQARQKYAKANNKYMSNYNKNTESSFLQYLDANNQHV